MTITDAYFGNGAYALKGYNVRLIENNDQSNPRLGWCSIEEETKDNGNTWKSRLYITRINMVDGAEYELAMTNIGEVLKISL